ncbi:MAG: Holliday junction resolvase RuvX [Bacteroidales bacterium]|nr:Holliday junction resolvase RuvX [Bacteroidales bacterium]
MGRILAIDYGSKRVGLAVTDPLKIIANNLGTVHSKDIIDFIESYIKNEKVECIVVGHPKKMNNEPSEIMPLINAFLKELNKHFPEIPVQLIDERFTSKLALRAMIEGGMKKKDRQNKSNIDAVSATILLQHYLQMIKK